MQNPFGGTMVHGLAVGGGLLVALLAVYAGGLSHGQAHAAGLAATRPAVTTPAVIGSVVVTTTTHLPTPETTATSANAAPAPRQHPHNKQAQPDHKRGKPSDGTKSSRVKGGGQHHHGH